MHGLKSSQVLFCFGFSGMQVSSFPSTIVEESVFPPCIFLMSLSQTNCPHKCRFISKLSIMFHSSMCLFLCHSHTVLMTITLYYSLKSGHAIPPVLFFFLKIVLAIQSPLCSHIDFRIIGSCSIKKKCCQYFDSDCTESVDCLGQYGYFNDINSSNPGTQYIFPSVCVVFNFFHQYLTIFQV